VLGGADVGVVDEADGPVAVRPALDLGERDVPEGEGGEHLEEHGGALLVVREHDAGLERSVRARHDGLPRQHHEAGHVPGVVLDAVGQHLHPVQLGGAGRRDGGRVAEPVGGHVLGGARRVVERLADDVEAHGRERVLALRQRLRVAHHPGQALLAHPGQRQQAVVHGELHLTDDVEPVTEQQVVVAVDAAAQGVLHGEHGAVGDPQLHGLERHLELVAGDGVAARVRLPGRLLAVRAGHALVRHAQLRPVHRSRGQVRDAERLRQVRLGDGAAGDTSHGDQIQHRPVLARLRGRRRRDVAVDGVRPERGHLAGQHGAAALPVRPAADDRALQRAPDHASAPRRGVAREPRILADRRLDHTRCSHCDTPGRLVQEASYLSASSVSWVCALCLLGRVTAGGSLKLQSEKLRRTRACGDSYIGGARRRRLVWSEAEAEACCLECKGVGGAVGMRGRRFMDSGGPGRGGVGSVSVKIYPRHTNQHKLPQLTVE